MICAAWVVLELVVNRSRTAGWRTPFPGYGLNHRKRTRVLTEIPFINGDE